MCTDSLSRGGNAAKAAGIAPLGAIEPQIDNIPIEQREALYRAFLDAWKEEAERTHAVYVREYRTAHEHGFPRESLEERRRLFQFSKQECSIVAILREGITPGSLVEHYDMFGIESDENFTRLELVETLYDTLFPNNQQKENTNE